MSRKISIAGQLTGYVPRLAACMIAAFVVFFVSIVIDLFRKALLYVLHAPARFFMMKIDAWYEKLEQHAL